MASERRIGLDLVRGAAILLVLLFHLRLPLGHPIAEALLQPVFAAGWVGVDLFFVLSGFLVGRMILTEAAEPTGLDRSRFMTRRALRLWPVLWCFLAPLVLLGGAPAWRSVWPVLLHIQNFDDQAPSHLWSLAVEEHFYLGAALVVPPLLRAGGHRLVGRFLLCVMAACLLLRLIGLAAGEPLLHLQWRTQYRIDAPAFGVLLALVALRRPDAFARLARWRGPLLIVSLLGLALAGSLDGGWRHGPGFTLAYLASGAAVVALADLSPPRSGAAVRVLTTLGLMAYPLYVWHASVGAMVRGTLPLGRVPSEIVIGLGLLLSIAVAWMVHHSVEKPFLRWRDRGLFQPSGDLVMAAR